MRVVGLLLALCLLAGALPLATSPQASAARGGSDASGKDPVLSSSLVRITDAVQEDGVAPESAARQARVSQDDGVAVTVVTDGADGRVAAVTAALTALGATGLLGGVEIIEGFLPVEQLRAAAALDGVLAIREQRPAQAQVTTQGVAAHNATYWQQRGYDGNGIRVAVIDIGFSGVQSLIGSELPQVQAYCFPSGGPATQNVANCDRGEKHGTAVAESLIDVAPGVTLFIANPQNWSQLHQTVNWMISQGVQIINHSVGWAWEGPGDGLPIYADGSLATVDRAVAAGILWINAAGNEGQSTWTGAAVDSDGDGLLELPGGSERNALTARAGYSLTLQMRWDDTWGGAQTDLDLYLVDAGGNVLAQSDDQQQGGPADDPWELLTWTPFATQTVYVEMRYYSGPLPARMQMQAFSGEVLQVHVAEYSVGVPAESISPGMVSVGAANWATPEVIEAFSSRGPTLDGRVKPELTGVDFGDTVSYGAHNFSGTSQASPHVAGLAALAYGRYPAFAPDDMASYLIFHAKPRGTSPNSTWGAGLAYLPDYEQQPDNPVPTITAVDPTSVLIGSGAAQVLVTATDIVPGVRAHINGSERSLVQISQTQLLVTLTAADTDANGDLLLTLTNLAPGGGASEPVILSVIGTLAPEDDPAFAEVWARTDLPVRDLGISRTWMWGNARLSEPLLEEYDDAPGGQRTVIYWDKSRMEVTNPGDDIEDPWYVTNGLLVVELVTGNLQVGDARFETLVAAEVAVAGDLNDPDSPTYATFAALLGSDPLLDGSAITQRLHGDGTVTDEPALAERGVTAAHRVTLTGIDHQVASIFWDFMNSTGAVWQNEALEEDALFLNPFYATGLPISEAYWTEVNVAGVAQDVLVQCFERRCLTYTPGNDAGWQVEAGNVGLHYWVWRYGTDPREP